MNWMPYMADVTPETLVQLRLMALEVAQRLLREDTLTLDNYLDEARKMAEFLVSGTAPLPTFTDDVPDDLSGLDPVLQDEEFDEDWCEDCGCELTEDDDEAWSPVYSGPGTGTMGASVDEVLWSLPEGFTWVRADGEPEPEEDDEPEEDA